MTHQELKESQARMKAVKERLDKTGDLTEVREMNKKAFLKFRAASERFRQREMNN